MPEAYLHHVIGYVVLHRSVVRLLGVLGAVAYHTGERMGALVAKLPAQDLACT
jgi:hypothetical protein